MGLSWTGYIIVYYLMHVLLYPIIYCILIMILPSELMNWLLDTLFDWENDDSEENSSKPESITTSDNKMKKKKIRKNPQEGCICEATWNCLWSKFSKLSCHCCSISCCNTCCTLFCEIHNAIDDKIIPYDYRIPPNNNATIIKNQVEQEGANVKTKTSCCDRLRFYMKNRVCIYMILCTSVWCASIYFFEGVILGYAPVGKGNNCPIPKKASDSIVMDCYVYEKSFSRYPINRTFSIPCNITTPVKFDGEWAWAACFGWISPNIEVFDVIDALGVSTAITAFMGGTVILISFLCRKHRWRLMFDILLCLAIPAIVGLITIDGHVPFLTYTLIASLMGDIITIEYLHKYIPLVTGLCLTNQIFYTIKKCRFKSNKVSTIPSSTENQEA